VTVFCPRRTAGRSDAAVSAVTGRPRSSNPCHNHICAFIGEWPQASCCRFPSQRPRDLRQHMLRCSSGCRASPAVGAVDAVLRGWRLDQRDALRQIGVVDIRFQRCAGRQMTAGGIAPRPWSDAGVRVRSSARTATCVAGWDFGRSHRDAAIFALAFSAPISWESIPLVAGCSCSFRRWTAPEPSTR